jgi:hypothetical protein
MISDIKSTTKSALDSAGDFVSDNLPKGLLFWSAFGAAVAAGAVYFIKPLRSSLLRLVGLGRKRRTRAVAKRRPSAHRIVRSVSRTRASRPARSRKMAHAR